MAILRTAIAICLLLGAGIVHAVDLVIAVDDTNQIAFSKEDLLSMAPAELTTATPWDGDEPPATYQGIYLEDLFAEVAQSPDQIRAIALNRYSSDIPFKEAIEAQAFVAVLRNGEPMPIRDRGPYWLIFPFFADDQATPINVLTPWAVWQLQTLEVLD
ncbi:hypothetical protein [Reinekea blandensis]|uniref:Oxidoreductase molybdopterin-binding domain-containing protein n=1 Tax=Reinekea blandensis MED297 TaxID=314283 RepID=A4BCU8_9GAMM|nr:hypothetical protein [Reinekea blandensis]EAR10030.1 hypothetical protein MED297_08076 [Reinekea sp. MED297] [Reinekea blandensis MED297]